MVGVVPIADQKVDLAVGNRVRSCYDTSRLDHKGSEATGCPLEVDGRKVCEGSNLILNLEFVCPIRVWRDWTIGS